MNTPIIDIDPVIFSIDSLGLQVRWYGFMYVLGFIVAGFLVKNLVRRKFFKIPEEKIDSFITTIIICMFIGARTVYVFVYNWDYYSNHLGEFFAVWQGGLSFHGAVLGMLFAGWYFARKNKIYWSQAMDVMALGGGPGLFFGRMGNLINGELYGRITDSPFGVIFPQGGPYPRHPSQIYEGVMEGIVLTIILWVMVRKVKYYGQIGATFLIGYGVFRYIIEFFREADSQLGYYFGGTTTMGQILCMIMVLAGILHFYFSTKRKLEI